MVLELGRRLTGGTGIARSCRSQMAVRVSAVAAGSGRLRKPRWCVSAQWNSATTWSRAVESLLIGPAVGATSAAKWARLPWSPPGRLAVQQRMRIYRAPVWITCLAGLSAAAGRHQHRCSWTRHDIYAHDGAGACISQARSSSRGASSAGSSTRTRTLQLP